MARIFLDTNIVLDAAERKKEYSADILAGHALIISPLSLHILAYVYKYACPSEALQAATEAFGMVSLNQMIAARSALGPTSDYEDNIQLQSASFADCDYFLTSDKNLLALGVFEAVKIVAHIPE